MNRTGRLEELRRALSDTIADHMGAPLNAVELAVAAATEGWNVDRKKTPSPDDHPLAEVKHGHYIRITLPWVPETDAERTERELWKEAFFWSADDGPPPVRVGVTQLLRQETWWRMNNPQPEGPGATPTVAIRVEDMTHDHRLALLEWLRVRARNLHSAVFAQLYSAPDEVRIAHEHEDPDKWLERQPLVQALVRWTTPWAESPLTWRPMSVHPESGTEVMARWVEEACLGDEFVHVRWLGYLREWWAVGGSGDIGDSLVEWRELYDHEKSLPSSLWRPMSEAPLTHGASIVARHPEYGDEIIVSWNDTEGWWRDADGFTYLVDDFAEWCELRDDEESAP